MKGVVGETIDFRPHGIKFAKHSLHYLPQYYYSEQRTLKFWSLSPRSHISEQKLSPKHLALGSRTKRCFEHTD